MAIGASGCDRLDVIARIPLDASGSSQNQSLGYGSSNCGAIAFEERSVDTASPLPARPSLQTECAGLIVPAWPVPDHALRLQFRFTAQQYTYVSPGATFVPQFAEHLNAEPSGP